MRFDSCKKKKKGLTDLARSCCVHVCVVCVVPDLCYTHNTREREWGFMGMWGVGGGGSRWGGGGRGDTLGSG